ncbi:hypothetical protein KEM48_006330 [Puccinia striiformis f. sp. tritici PST-130]|nr:hypothetical protein KEM48_006330 [Puccinia striiformis f. sp. tritici PST-130]
MNSAQQQQQVNSLDQAINAPGIFDSIITFSQYGWNELMLMDYDRLAKNSSSLEFSSTIDICLILTLSQTGKVTCSLNDHLQELCIHSFNAMLLFVVQVNC